MEAAYEVFAALEEPTGAEEDWRYVEFDHTFSELHPVAAPGAELEASPFVASLPERSGRVLIVDGQVLSHHSDVATVHRFSELEDDPGFTGMVPTPISIPEPCSRSKSRRLTSLPSPSSFS